MRCCLALWALALLPCAVRAKEVSTRQAPSYAASSLVNLATGLPGPFAPNTLVALYGRDLSIDTVARDRGENANPAMPKRLGTPSVYVNIGGFFAPLEYISPEVVIFLIPADQGRGKVKIFLARNNLRGPDIRIMVDDFAPALFEQETSQAFARHAVSLDVVGALSPAAPGETIILYASGLGEAERPRPLDEAPAEFMRILHRDQLTILLDGQPLDRRLILKAGLAEGRTGCYEIYLRLPHDTPEDPEIIIAMGDASSRRELRLPVRWSSLETEPQPFSADVRSRQ